MTIIQLQYLIEVANCGSFSAASEHCFVTQPSLSMQIKSLEEELGVILLDRSKKPVIPTEAGAIHTLICNAVKLFKIIRYSKNHCLFIFLCTLLLTVPNPGPLFQ